MATIELDDDDIRTIYTIMHYAEKFAGLDAHNAVSRILAKLPALEAKEEKDAKVQ